MLSGLKPNRLMLFLVIIVTALPACRTAIRGDDETATVSASTSSASKHAYITHNLVAAPQISVCDINATTGYIENCQFDPLSTDGGIVTNGSNVQAVASVTLGGTQYVYFQDEWNQTMYVCTLSASYFYTGCAATGSTGVWFPSSMAIKELSGTTYAYVSSSGENKIYLCTVNTSDGSLNGCAPTTLAANGFISLDDSTGTTYIYVAQFAIWNRCPVNTLNGAINSGACSFTAGFNGGIPMVYSSAFTTVNGTRHAYYGEGGSGNIFSCTINAGDGELVCALSITGIDFSSPTGLAVNDAGTKLYVTDNGNGAVYTCDIKQTDGTIDTCAVTDGGIGQSMVNQIGIF